MLPEGEHFTLGGREILVFSASSSVGFSHWLYIVLSGAARACKKNCTICFAKRIEGCTPTEELQALQLQLLQS